MKTPCVVALPFIYGVEYIIISNQKKGILLFCKYRSLYVLVPVMITAGIFITVQPHLSIKAHQAKDTSKAFLEVVTLTFDL